MDSNALANETRLGELTGLELAALLATFNLLGLEADRAGLLDVLLSGIAGTLKEIEARGLSRASNKALFGALAGVSADREPVLRAFAELGRRTLIANGYPRAADYFRQALLCEVQITDRASIFQSAGLLSRAPNALGLVH